MVSIVREVTAESVSLVHAIHNAAAVANPHEMGQIELLATSNRTVRRQGGSAVVPFTGVRAVQLPCRYGCDPRA